MEQVRVEVYTGDSRIIWAWETFAHKHLSKVLPHTTHFSLKDILQYCLDGSMQLWGAHIDGEYVAAFTTSVAEYPQTSELECVHLGGKQLKVWAPEALKQLDIFAKANNCSSLVVSGRAGTERLYKPFGFVKDTVVLKRAVK